MGKEHRVVWLITFFMLFEMGIFLILHNVLNVSTLFGLLLSGAIALSAVLMGRRHIIRLISIEKSKQAVSDEDENYIDRMNNTLQNVTRKMRKQIYDLHNLFEVSINLTSILEPQQLIKSSILSLIGQLQTNQAIVFLPSKKDPGIVYPIYSKGFSRKQWKDFFISLEDPLFQRFDKKMIAINLHQVEEEIINEKWSRLIESGISLVAPIIPKKQIKGLIAVGQKMNEEYFTRSEQEIFSLLAHFISVAFSNSMLYQKMEQISITDELTGLYNYRYFKKRLENEILRAKRYSHSLSLILFDVDYFKNYNDVLGHPSGDVALRNIANILKSSIRKSDIPVRYGGEEFCVILPEANINDAKLFAERLRRKIEAYPFEGKKEQPGGKLTISIGVASFPETAESLQSMIDRADAALYNAKRQGRNKTCLISEIVRK
jgi:diguanylate cyclase (GGDEF)-like protein